MMDRHTLESGFDAGQPVSKLHPIKTEASQRVRRITVASICVLAGLFCIWRMSVFVPQPLDSSSTLRPVLYKLFSRFLAAYNTREQAFLAWYGFCAIILLAPPVLAVLNYLRQYAQTFGVRVPGLLCSRLLFFASVAFCFAFCRYPTLLEPQLNPDEGQFLASADKLFYDGNFFRADDCGTSGPVNIYPLMLPAIFGITPDFASSRVIAIAILFLCVWLLYATIRLLAPDEIARIAILPAAGIFAVFKHPNLVHYSSEHVPVLLASVGFYLVVRILAKPAEYRLPLFLLGFLSSAAFFSKLQAVPILVSLSAVAIAYVCLAAVAGHSWRRLLLYVAGVLPLPIVQAILCLTVGIWHDVWMSYIVTNIRYAAIENRFVTDMPQLLKYLTETDEVRTFLFTVLGLAVAYAYQRFGPEPALISNALLQSAVVSTAAISLLVLLSGGNYATVSTYLALIAIAAVPMYFLLRRLELPMGNDPLRWFGLLSVIFTAVSMFAVYEAHRPFPHYLLFLYIPICTGIGWMTIRQQQNSETARPNSFPVAFMALVAILAAVCQLYLWGNQDDHVFKNVMASIRPPEGDVIRSMTTADGQITVWGWTVDPYVGSGRVPATRDTTMVYFFGSTEINAYYRNRFLRDMKEDPPEMFIDAVGPTSWALNDRKAYNFEQFPEIETFVRLNYAHLADLYGQRYFLRRDLAARNAKLRTP